MGLMQAIDALELQCSGKFREPALYAMDFCADVLRAYLKSGVAIQRNLGIQVENSIDQVEKNRARFRSQFS
jgi:hypothetical protein